MQLLRGLIGGGVRNPIYANLLMVCILVGGALSARQTIRESFPEFSLDHISIQVTYPGASTADIERAICTPIEESVQGISGVYEISSSAQENFGIVWLALRADVRDISDILFEVKDRVDQILTFPPGARKPVIRESIIRGGVINVAIYGDVPESTLKGFAHEVRDDLLSKHEISQILFSGVREDEIIIEVSKAALAAYNLSLPQVISVLAKSSLDLPAGVIRTTGEEFTLRTSGRQYRAWDYENLVLVDRGDAAVRVGDIANVREGFEETEVHGWFNGQRAVVVQVFKTPQEDAIEIAESVRNYVSLRQPYLPSRLKMSVWADNSHDIESRMRMLVENGLWGILFVFLTLTIFLEVRLAAWVTVGIPVAFAGALIVVYALGQTLNMISLFALIMVSGIIVDDAIVIAESIYAHRRAGMSPELAATEGTYRVSLPVLGASMTTIAAFAPLLYVSGVMGRFIYVLPVVVIAAVCASAIEAFGILPAHLCGHRSDTAKGSPRRQNRVRRWLDGGVDNLVTRWYLPLCRAAMRARLVTLSLAIGALLIAGGLVLGGRTPFVLLPMGDGNMLRARVRFPEGTPLSTTNRAVDRITSAAWALNDDPDLVPASGGKLIRQVYAVTGEFVDFMSFQGNNLCEVRVELNPAEQRRIPDEEIVERWRRNVGVINDATRVKIGSNPLGPLESPIEIRLLGTDLDDMTAASERIQDKLREFEGLFNVEHDLIPGKRELIVTLSPAARTLGLTLDDLGTQLRFGFYGGEVVKLQRGRDLVAVRVRYPEDERRSLADLDRMWVKTPKGFDVPFRDVADVRWTRGYSFIMHQDGKRRVRVIAEVDDRRANAEQIVTALNSGFLQDVVSDYDGLTYTVAGNREYLAESLESLFLGFAMAMIVIYTILAGTLRSYFQPLVILLAIPLGLIGVIGGHALLGVDVTLMSIFGAVALSGVVVNDSLVLIDAINRGIGEGKSVYESVVAAGVVRFRAVTITSITTIAGLMPILLERSSQAQSLKPMAIALCFGLLVATGLTLIVVPATYLLLNDVRRFVYWLRYGGAYPAAEVVEEARPRQPSETASVD